MRVTVDWLQSALQISYLKTDSKLTNQRQRDKQRQPIKTLIVSRVRLVRMTVENMRVMYVLLSDNIALKKQCV